MSATISTLYGIAVYDSSVYDAPEAQLIASGSTNFVIATSIVQSAFLSLSSDTSFNTIAAIISSNTFSVLATSNSTLSSSLIIVNTFNSSAVGLWGLAFAKITKNSNIILTSDTTFDIIGTFIKENVLSNINAFIASSFTSEIPDVKANIDTSRYGILETDATSEWSLTESLFVGLIFDEWSADLDFFIDAYLNDVDIPYDLYSNGVIYEEYLFQDLYGDANIFVYGKDGEGGTTSVPNPISYAIGFPTTALIIKIWTLDLNTDSIIQQTSEREMSSTTVIQDILSINQNFDAIIQASQSFDLNSDALISLYYEQIFKNLNTNAIIRSTEQKQILSDTHIYDGGAIVPEIIIYTDAEIALPLVGFNADALIVDFYLLFFNLSSSLNLVFANAVVLFADNYFDLKTDGFIIRSEDYIPAETPGPSFVTFYSDAFILERGITLSLVRANISYYSASYYAAEIFILPTEISQAGTYIKTIRATAYIQQDVFEISADSNIIEASASQEKSIAINAIILEEIFVSIPIKANIGFYRGQPKEVSADAFIGYRIFPVPAKERIV